MKISHLLDLPVVLVDQGLQIGFVQDALPHQQKGELVELVVTNHLDKSYHVAWSKIQAIGSGAVLVRSAQEASLVDSGMEGINAAWIGKKLLTDDGESLGEIADVNFNSQTGEILGYELSDGLISDLYQGRRQIPYPLAQVVGQDCFIVPMSAAKLLSK